MLPTVFIAHGGGPAHMLDYTGSPFAFMDKNSPSRYFLSSLSSVIKVNTPSAATPLQCILIISAHWEEPKFTVDYQTGPTKLIYDYYGFPEEAYAPLLTYPVKTNLPIADRIIDLLQQAKIPVAKQGRGFDHGVFCPMKVMYPDPNEVPIIQLSLKQGLDIEEHIKLGEALRPLRSEGVLILGSGSTTHNLRAMRQQGFNAGNPDPKAKAFLDYLHDFLKDTTPEAYEAKKEEFRQFDVKAPYFAHNHPRTEHFVPLVVVFGASFIPSAAADENDKDQEYVKRIYEEIAGGVMGLDSYLFH